MKKKFAFSFCIFLFFTLLTFSVSAKLLITSYCDVSLESCKSQDQALMLLQEKYVYDIEVHYLYYFDTSNAKSSLANIALECANREGMKENYKQYLQDHLGEEEISRASLKSSAENAGLFAANFSFCLDTQQTAYDVLSEIENAEEEGVTSVPAVRFGQDIYTDSQTYTSLNTLIQQYLDITETEDTRSQTQEITSQVSDETTTTKTSSKEVTQTSSSGIINNDEDDESQESEEIQNIEEPLFFRVIRNFRTWMLGLFS